MLRRRLAQFLLIYALSVAFLFAVKYLLNLSDYVIPSPADLTATAAKVSQSYLIDTVNTLGVAVIGHLLAISMATVAGIIGRLTNWAGSLIRVAAFNLQAYPIVAVAPIIFILLGDGLPARLLIAAIVCYFPLLLAFIGILTEPITDIEHFYAITGRMRWQLEVKIRVFENIHQLITVIAGSATLAMVGTIVAEFIGADAGIGYSLRIALAQSDMAKVLVALFLIGICNSLYLTALEWAGFLLRQRLELVNGEAA